MKAQILPTERGGRYLGSEEVRVGARVRVRGDHRVESRRGALGKIVDTYGGEEFMAVDVQFPDGRRRLFWPADLEGASGSSSPSRAWWDSLLRGD